MINEAMYMDSIMVEEIQNKGYEIDLRPNFISSCVHEFPRKQVA